MCCGLDESPSNKHRFFRALGAAYSIAGTGCKNVCEQPERQAHVDSLACSVGVYVQEFGTVITTDNLLTPGFFDLSLCPTRSSMAGCVVSQAKAFHDNTSVLRLVSFTLVLVTKDRVGLSYSAEECHSC